MAEENVHKDNRPVIGTFQEYLVEYNRWNKNPYIVILLSDVVLCSDEACFRRESGDWDPFYVHTDKVKSRSYFRQARVTYRYTFDTCGMLEPGDIIYLEAYSPEYFWKGVHGEDIAWLRFPENICLLNRENVVPYPDDCISSKRNSSTKSYSNLVKHLSSLYPNMTQLADERWAKEVASYRFKYKIGDKLYRLHSPRNSDSFRFEVSDQVFEICGYETRCSNACYLVCNEQNDQTILVAQRRIDPRRSKKGYLLESSRFFTTRNKALEREKELNDALDETGLLHELL